ncbi:ATP-binding protein [Methanoregula sp. UBA64]|jgi:serine/threonine-protein kinase RsbW|uniref:ATP-binding protein n=1 Tax=Methanoregula sp. UBA64 TaxID=1915554 RepID=UPI0025DA72F5|nr:ATP-binding protein [Methanoregula sp. UBA64]
MTVPPDIVIPSHLEEIPRISAELEQCMQSMGFSDDQILDLQLAVEEAITNVIKHGYEETPGTITIRCTRGDDEIAIEISDSAPAFDPLSVPEPDTSADIDQRGIGGLGIFLIRRVTDSATYRYEQGKNILTLTKKKSLQGRVPG